MTIRENYEQWLKDFAGDEETIRELEAIRDDEKEMEDRFYTELSFGTAGMRGVLGAGMNRMNKYNVRRATKGLAGYLLEKPEEAKRGVVIAYDSRRCSAEFAKDTALVLCAEGVPAYLFDALRPVPVLSYAVRHLHAIAGVVITASHNPPQYNGYKVYGEDGAQVGPEAAEGITRIIRATKYTDCTLMDEQEALAGGLLKIIIAAVVLLGGGGFGLSSLLGGGGFLLGVENYFLGFLLGCVYDAGSLFLRLGKQGFALFLAFGQSFPIKLVSQFLKLVIHNNDVIKSVSDYQIKIKEDAIRGSRGGYRRQQPNR